MRFTVQIGQISFGIRIPQLTPVLLGKSSLAIDLQYKWLRLSFGDTYLQFVTLTKSVSIRTIILCNHMSISIVDGNTDQHCGLILLFVL